MYRDGSKIDSWHEIKSRVYASLYYMLQYSPVLNFNCIKVCVHVFVKFFGE